MQKDAVQRLLNIYIRMEAGLDFRVEAEQSVKEVAYAIGEGGLSKSLESKTTCAYINLTTVEGRRFTVRLSQRGFEVSCAVAIEVSML